MPLTEGLTNLSIIYHQNLQEEKSKDTEVIAEMKKYLSLPEDLQNFKG